MNIRNTLRLVSFSWKNTSYRLNKLLVIILYLFWVYIRFYSCSIYIHLYSSSIYIYLVIYKHIAAKIKIYHSKITKCRIIFKSKCGKWHRSSKIEASHNQSTKPSAIASFGYTLISPCAYFLIMKCKNFASNFIWLNFFFSHGRDKKYLQNRKTPYFMHVRWYYENYHWQFMSRVLYSNIEVHECAGVFFFSIFTPLCTWEVSDIISPIENSLHLPYTCCYIQRIE